MELADPPTSGLRAQQASTAPLTCGCFGATNRFLCDIRKKQILLACVECMLIKLTWKAGDQLSKLIVGISKKKKMYQDEYVVSHSVYIHDDLSNDYEYIKQEALGGQTTRCSPCGLYAKSTGLRKGRTNKSVIVGISESRKCTSIDLWLYQLDCLFVIT